MKRLEAVAIVIQCPLVDEKIIMPTIPISVSVSVGSKVVGFLTETVLHLSFKVVFHHHQGDFCLKSTFLSYSF